MPDAVVVGAGQNGLAAAVTLARAGLSVEVVERSDTIGGTARTAELTLPGFRHDVGAAVHPMALQSEFFRRFELERRIAFLLPEVQYAHPFDDGRAGLAWRELDRTADALGADAAAYRSLLGPLVRGADDLSEVTGGALLQFPQHPMLLVRLAARLLEQGTVLGRRRFRGPVAPGMLAGVGAHAIARMPSIAASAVALTLSAYAHARGWPIPVGGSQSVVDALAEDLRAHGGRIETGREIRSLADVSPARAVLFDTSVPAMLRIAGARIPAGRRTMLRSFRFGNAAAKVDFALSEPVPWAAAGARRAGTLHLGGTWQEIAAAEREVAHGRVPERPYVLVSQPTVVDPSRAPAGRHVLWAYAHVPAGSDVDPTEMVVAQVERFAPGFRDVILAPSSRSAREIGAVEVNAVAGDIATGAATLRQLIARPLPSADPWRMGGGVYLCSAASAPGPGVHGMGGWHAARSALRHTYGLPGDVELGIESR